MKSIKRLLKSDKGFTLVEVIVAMAVFAVIVFAFSNLFVNSYSGIHQSGRVSQSLFTAQQNLEQQIINGATSDSEQLDIEIPNYSTIQVNGEYVTGTHDHGTITTFIPKH